MDFAWYHVFLQFLYPLRGFSVYSCIFNLFFQDFYPSPFCTISSGLLHFQYIFPRVLPVSFIFRSFLRHFLSLLSHFPALSLYFSSMFTASSWFVPSVRSGFLHFPRDFPWFVPSIRSVFVRFPGDFVRFPLIGIMFSCSFIAFSNTSSWSLRPPKRRT